MKLLIESLRQAIKERDNLIQVLLRDGFEKNQKIILLRRLLWERKEKRS